MGAARPEDEEGESGLRLCWRFYSRMLKERPRLTNCVVSLTLSSLGDAIAQCAEMQFEVSTARSPGAAQGFDLQRNYSLAVTSGFWNGAVLCTWFAMLDRKWPKRDKKSVVSKVAATQGFLNSMVYVPYFFILHGTLAGQNKDEVYGHIAQDHFQLLFRLWSIFIPCYIINFALIPVDFQVLWISCISLIWNVILSVFTKPRQRAIDGIVSMMMGLNEFGGDQYPFIGEVISSMNPFGEEDS